MIIVFVHWELLSLMMFLRIFSMSSFVSVQLVFKCMHRTVSCWLCLENYDAPRHLSRLIVNVSSFDSSEIELSVNGLASSVGLLCNATPCLAGQT